MDQHSTSSANSQQIGGEHYKSSKAVGACPHCKGEIQHWDWACNLSGLEYAATKYTARHAEKNGAEDILKAIHYLSKILEQRYPEAVKKETPITTTLGLLTVKELIDRGMTVSAMKYAAGLVQHPIRFAPTPEENTE